jgi:hypothetical protein
MALANVSVHLVIVDQSTGQRSIGQAGRLVSHSISLDRGSCKSSRLKEKGKTTRLGRRLGLRLRRPTHFGRPARVHMLKDIGPAWFHRLAWGVSKPARLAVGGLARLAAGFAHGSARRGGLRHLLAW